MTLSEPTVRSPRWCSAQECGSGLNLKPPFFLHQCKRKARNWKWKNAFSTKVTSVWHKSSLLFPPSNKLRSYHYWHRSQIRAELCLSCWCCTAKNYFIFLLHLSTLLSREMPVILPVMTPVEHRSIINISEWGNTQSGGVETQRKKAHTLQPAQSCCCHLRCWSEISSGICCLPFFFPDLSI